MGRACMYILEMLGTSYEHPSGDKRAAVKIGTSWHPEARKWHYFTGSPLSVRYRCLLFVEGYPSLDPNLYKLDRYFLSWLERQGRASELHLDGAGGIEWYWDAADYQQLLSEFLTSRGLSFEVQQGDPFPYRAATSSAAGEALGREFELQFSPENLKAELERLALAGRRLRRIQSELVDVLHERLSNLEDPLRGVIQWPTGAGKTVAIIACLLAALRLRFTGQLLRALVICPQKNIFDSTYDALAVLDRVGLPVLKGYGAYTSQELPQEGSGVLLVCHARLTDHPELLQGVNLVLYDEVHRVTGPKMLDLITQALPRLEVLLGTSATPVTGSAQKEQLQALFGPEPLHYCDYKTAIEEGYICRPRFNIYLHPEQSNRSYLVEKSLELLATKQRLSGRSSLKSIVYTSAGIEASAEVQAAFMAEPQAFGVELYNANIQDQGLVFQTSTASGTHLLFACQKYREGSDIRHLEMATMVLQSAPKPHVLVQVVGRALRMDYPGKEGWCNIFYQADRDKSAHQVLEEVFRFLSLECGLFDIEPGDLVDAEKAQRAVGQYLGEVMFDQQLVMPEESVRVLQGLYTRSRKGGYSLEELRRYNKKMNIRNKAHFEELVRQGQYLQGVSEYPDLDYKGKGWLGWGHFLADETDYPAFEEWVEICRQHQLKTSKAYKDRRSQLEEELGVKLPEKPQEIYKSFTNLKDALKGGRKVRR